MKKRAISLALAVVLIVCLLPTAAFAATNGKTADDAINWVKSVEGQTVGSGECVALIVAYYSYLGQTSPGGDGKDYSWNQLPAGWTRIQNAQPQKGDILVYSGSEKNSAGHVAIYESDYSTWHQNYGFQRKVVHVTNVKYNGFDNPYWGVIRPDFSSATPTPSYADIGTNVYRYLIRTDGWKHIGTNYDSSNKSNVTIGKANTGDPEQIWKFIRQGDGSYCIQNMYNDYYLTYEGNCVQQAKVTTSLLNTNKASRFQWYIYDKNGTFQLVPKDSVTAGTWLVLDCTGNYQTAGTQMELYSNWSGAAQIFSLYPVENYQKPAAPPKVEITVPDVVTVGEEFTISWTASPLQGKYDQREYEVHIRRDGSGYKTLYTTDTSVTLSISGRPGDCSVAVSAINKKYQNYWSTSTAYFRCNKATVHEHSYDAVVTDPTCTEQGYTTHTCSCGESYKDSYVDALGHAWGNGKLTKAPTETATGVKTFTCARCGGTKTETVPSVDVLEKFTDVSDNWARSGIQYCVTHELMGGTGAGTFSPKTPTTRAQLVQMLYSLAGKPEVDGTTPFTDLTDNWYKDAVAWGYKMGVIGGISATTFAPNQPVTREQIAVILMKYVSNVLKQERTWTPADLSAYPDAGSVHGWAESAMADAVALGLISGVQNNGVNYLQPQGNATREQVATILMQFCKNVIK